MEAVRKLAESCAYEDGQVVFRAGEADLDLFIVESGGIEIINPSDDDRQIVVHGPGQFAGDIDLLTRRPVIVTGIARGPCHPTRRFTCSYRSPSFVKSSSNVTTQCLPLGADTPYGSAA